MYTICPSCHSVFRINAAQLGIAGGRVRCGECRQLFVALDRLYDTVADAQATLDGGTRETAQFAGPEAAGTADYPVAETTVGASFDEPQTETTAKPAPVHSAGHGIDAEDLVESKAPGAAGPWTDEHPMYRAARSTRAIDDDESVDFEEETGAHADGTGREDRVAAGEARENEDQAYPAAGSTVFGTWDESAAVEEKPGEIAERIAQKDGEADDGPHEDEAPGENLEDLPVEDEHLIAELRAASGKGRFGHLVRGALVALLLLAVLGGQYVWFVRPEWVYSQPVLRSWLERACWIFDCELPMRRDLASIELLDRDVRKHPRVDDALLVNATLVNKAAYRQPYPVLRLSFSDLSGTRLASRRFQPEEYLAPGSDASSGMPVRKQVHVMLELIDPGNKAVSFQFDFF